MLTARAGLIPVWDVWGVSERHVPGPPPASSRIRSMNTIITHPPSHRHPTRVPIAGTRSDRTPHPFSVVVIGVGYLL